MAIEKSKYWVGVLYPENMIDNWQSLIGDIVELPYAYCIHDKDLDKDSDERKVHVHLMLVYPNTTTYKHMMNVFDLLSASGKKCLSSCKACVSVRGSYNYLIHDTETARKDGKYQYDKSLRITGNNFDIGSYEQISISEKNEKCRELCTLIIDEKFTNFTDFYAYVLLNFDDVTYFELLKTYSGLFERLTRGNFQKYVIKKKDKKSKMNYLTGEILE